MLVFALLTLSGCSGDKLKELADKAKTAAQQGADSVKKQVSEQVDSATTEVQEQLNLAGEIQLTLDAPVETKACYVRLIPQGSNRPTVFELRSYRSPDQESAPSVFFHGQIRASSLEELSGQIVSGRLFVQPTADGPTWFSETGSPVEVQVVGMEDSVLTAEIVGASLRNTQSGESVDTTGTFRAVSE